MEAGRRLKDQELFYAELEGRHAAIDDIADPQEYSYPSLCQMMRYNDKVLVNFMKGYHESRKANSVD